jgi:PIN domain nuclease of toxin-antitoxin system
MTRFLLDTHAALWAFQGAQDLSARVIDILNDPKVTIYVSPVSAYEIALKTNLGKLPRLPKRFADLAEESDFSLFTVTANHFELAGQLPLINRDPWDRILSAQALHEGMALISRDSAIATLGAQIVW